MLKCVPSYHALVWGPSDTPVVASFCGVVGVPERNLTCACHAYVHAICVSARVHGMCDVRRWCAAHRYPQIYIGMP